MTLAFASPVSLMTGIFGTGSSTAAKSAPFELRAGSFELKVISFRGEERVNDIFEYEVTFATEEDPEAIHSTLLGDPPA
jgi:hypothetical protein